MKVLTHGLLLRPLTPTSSNQLFYEIGLAGPDAFTVYYVGQTADGANRFDGQHDGLRRAVARGADTILVAPVYGESNRRAIETIMRFEMEPLCNAEPVPTIGEYLSAKVVWADYQAERSMLYGQPMNALATAAPMPWAPTASVGNALARTKPDYSAITTALMTRPNR
ncbi:hypothetical protein [Hyphomonas sp.]|uniref:hypothetical protein n=1 Tax=Hyphomonas sp. TaxID=87 RepID=UPI0030036C46